MPLIPRYLTAIAFLLLPLTAVPGLSQQAAEAPAPTPTPAPTGTPSPGAAQGTALQQVAPESTPPLGVTAFDCSSCSDLLMEARILRVEKAASTLEDAARNFQPDDPEDDQFWSDVFTNIFSNQLDSMIFGKGPESKGLIALIAAWASLFAAIVKLCLACVPPKSSSGTPSAARRRFEIGLSAFLVVTAALGVLAVHSGRATVRAAIAEEQDASREIDKCNDRLQAAGLAKSQSSSSAITCDALERIESACAVAGAGTATQLETIQDRADSIYAVRVGFMTKLWVFLGFLGVAYLVWRSIADDLQDVKEAERR